MLACAGGQVELREEVADVSLDGLGADEELGCQACVGQALGHESEHFSLAVAQPGEPVPLAAAADEPGDELGVDHHLPGGDAADIDGEGTSCVLPDRRWCSACVATLSMTAHLFAAIGADSLADGEHSLVSRLQTVNETVVDTAWGLALATLAVAGGLTRTVGNRFTIAFGLVGGLAFALASATIAYTDTFDSLFKLGSLLSIWAILVGSLAIRRREAETETAKL